jgi:hypothetical protein
VFARYYRPDYNSFTPALYSGPLNGDEAFRLNQLSMFTRTSLVWFYASHAIYPEQIHWDAPVDRTPEVLAAELDTHFSL